MKTFTELNLSAPLAQALAEVDYVEMTPVQAATLPAILAGRDVLAQAQTGSGKTAAFALGLLAALDPQRLQLQGLVLCPTRELADQVSREIRRLARFIPNVKILTLCGGVPLRPHLASLAHEPHLVVGTPGRLLELIEKKALPLPAVRTLVLDEADRMLDMGFGEAITGILSAIPKPRQTLLFSATIPPPIRDISRRLQRDALDVTVDDDPAVALIEQRFFEVDPSRKLAALSGLLLQHRPESAVVFCNTRQEVRTVASALTAQKFTALALHGELDQRERDELLVCFANRSATVLVASDVAARGLDIADLPMVINYDLANDPDTHLHRIGRTGRAGKRGLALSLCAPAEVPRARQIEQRTGERLRWLPWVPGGRTERAPQPAFRTVIVDAGRQDKLRPGDLLGALTGDAGLPATAIGKIDIFPTRSYVAIARDWHSQAVARLRGGKIKGRNFRIRELDLSA
ncbi:MAG: ATP-dependent RNA helicase DbpA [Gammaproteobacteria bacterium]|jgi:ATP-independent RNA helicase DbpA|nr:ATP-dependent RNA helicase DbpA [Gammaproteobacteria bacterium]